jgi:molybdopterin/thiamine biosynthesis adenylyltransferase
MNNDRFKGLRWATIDTYNGYLQEPRILIVGAGGIGSNAAYLLAKTDKAYTIVDFDIVEEHNYGGQFFKRNSIGKNKIRALDDTLRLFDANKAHSYFNARFDEKYIYEDIDIVISAVDSMAVRKEIFEAVVKKAKEYQKKILFIDGRLLAEYYKVIAFDTSEDAKVLKYKEELLKNDDDFEEENCTTKQTTHIAMRLGADIVTYINLYIENEIFGNRIKIPFIKDFNVKLGDQIIEL